MTGAPDDFVDLPDDLDPAPAASADPPSRPAKNGALSATSGGITGKGFKPGQSGNPSGRNGRQKGLASLVRFRTEEGRRLVELMWRIARGGKFRMSAIAKTGDVVEARLRPSVRDRMDAAAWLADRGWGKVKDVIKLEGEEGRSPVNIVFLGGPRADPLAEDAPPPRRALPRPPVVGEEPKPTSRGVLPPPAPIAEVEFEMPDSELPPNEGG